MCRMRTVGGRRFSADPHVMAADEKDDTSASSADPQARWSPRFAREQRRKNLVAGIVGIAMGAVVLVEAVLAMRAGTWVRFGSPSNSFSIPGWVAARAGVFVVFIGVMILWRNVFRRHWQASKP